MFFACRLYRLLVAVVLLSGLIVMGNAAERPRATVIEIEGTVETAAARSTEWRAAHTNDALAALDRLRTEARSRAALRLIDRSLFRLGERTMLTMESAADSQSPAKVTLVKGLLLFLHRGNPKDVEIRTDTVSAAIRGTEFQVEVADNGRTVLTLFDGDVELMNPQGTLRLVSGEQATVDPGQPPVKTPMLVPKNDLIQWCLYYPGILDVAELSLLPAEEAMLQSSLTAYRTGDLLAALAQIPAGFQPASDSARIYLAAVLLSVGNVESAIPLLDAVSRTVAQAGEGSSSTQSAEALRRIVWVVKNSPAIQPENQNPAATKGATLRLAESYQFQAQASLVDALAAARQAATQSPAFAFAWARVAELEFSFGRRREAQAALNRSLELAPRNAQAVALKGFLQAADDHIAMAFNSFNEAIALDGALGNAWLGRGLCRIRRGDVDGGREDLQIAVLLEPQRALLRSYLGKAWNEIGEQKRAEKELGLAMANDPKDPTAYLYEALLFRQKNRINEAVTALERSQALNDNRRVYRSRVLLDQDRAVRGANLANIYRDAGLSDWSLREARNAVSSDYASWSAHQFLADSYSALVDPAAVNLRYETPATTEHLVANLLSPVGGAPLSPVVSQLEYSRLFDRERIGLVTDTEYQSRGAWSERLVQHGRLGNMSYAIEVQHRSDPGWISFGDLVETSLSLRLKQQVSDQDVLYFESTGTDRDSGDLQTESRSRFRARDRIEPIVLGGWHHAWSPNSHTLMLVGHLASTYTERDPEFNHFNPGLAFLNNVIVGEEDRLSALNYRGLLSVQTAELQHILRSDSQTVVVGLQGQIGDFQTRSQQKLEDPSNFLDTNVVRSFETAFERWKFYAYHTWQAIDSVWITGGLTYDTMRFPANHRAPPISDGVRRNEKLSPKLGVVWNPLPKTSVRIAHSEGLTGTSFDQSFALEPTQVAGVNQAFRSLVPESIAGANAGVPLNVSGAGWEQRFGEHTYLVASATRYESNFRRDIGVFVRPAGNTAFTPSTIRESIAYREDSLGIALRHLFGDQWSAGINYRLSRANRRYDHPSVPHVEDILSSWMPAGNDKSLLNKVGFDVRYQGGSGFFAETTWDWWFQDNRSDRFPPATSLSHDSFLQGHVMGGWRSAQRRVELAVGILNIGDEFVFLAPVSGVTGIIRERTFVARLKMAF